LLPCQEVRLMLHEVIRRESTGIEMKKSGLEFCIKRKSRRRRNLKSDVEKINSLNKSGVRSCKTRRL
jgi:hypothetical protein